MSFEINLINLVLFYEWVMILKNKSDFWIMLEFNPISDSKLYLELQMSNWVVLYMDQNLRKSSSTFMLKPKSNSTFKDVKFYLEVEIVVLSKFKLYPLI